MIDPKKELLAVLETAEKFVSPQTHFFHLNYSERPFIKGDGIALYHNFLFVYALLKNKERETIERAIDLLQKLLYFQVLEGANRGNFPRYIHEYPFVERQFEVVDVLLPLYWIYHEFGHILNQELAARLRKALTLGMESLIDLKNDREYSYILSVQLHSLLYALGKKLDRLDISQDALKHLQAAFLTGPNKYWGSCRHLSKLILFLQLIEKEQSLFLDSFWSYLKYVWHPQMQCFIGPALNEHYANHQVEPTLYHYVMSKASACKSYPIFDADLLETLLIKNANIENNSVWSNKTYGLDPFSITQHADEKYAYSFFNLNAKDWEKRGGFYPFRLISQNAGGLHDTFALQMGNFVQIEQVQENKILFTFENTEHPDLDIAFYYNLSSQLEVLTNGKKASMFNLSDPIILQSPHLKLVLSFPNSTPERGIWGQLMRQNRQSQMATQLLQSFDGHLYFRKTQKNDTAPFQIQLEILKNN